MNTQLAERGKLATSAPARRPAAVKALIGLTALLGIGGVVGGIGLTADRSGDVFGYPVAWLDRTPFSDFLIPGLLLLLLLGVGPLVVAYGLLRKPAWRWTDAWNSRTGEHWAWTGALIVGVGVVAWIIVEILIVPDHSPGAWAVQGSTAMLGVAIMSLAASKAVRGYYRVAA